MMAGTAVANGLVAFPLQSPEGEFETPSEDASSLLVKVLSSKIESSILNVREIGPELIIKELKMLQFLLKESKSVLKKTRHSQSNTRQPPFLIELVGWFENLVVMYQKEGEELLIVLNRVFVGDSEKSEFEIENAIQRWRLMNHIDFVLCQQLADKIAALESVSE